jgi:DNA polymerase
MITKVHGLTIVGLDFETYTDQWNGYTLKYGKSGNWPKRLQNLGIYKPGTSDYIRDARFKAHGMSLKLTQKRKAKWVSHANIASELAKIDWSKTALLAHNTAFDALILTHHYGHTPAYYLDTMSMARPLVDHLVSVGLEDLGERLGLGGKEGSDILEKANAVRELPPALERDMARYAIRDIDLCSLILQQWIRDYPRDELDLINLSIKAFAEPVVRINKARIKRELDAEIQEKEDLFHQAMEAAGVDNMDALKEILGSENKLADALSNLGVDPPTKWSEKQGKEIWAFAKPDLGFQKLGRSEDPRVRALVAARLAIKSSLSENRAQRLYDRRNLGPMPIMLNYCRAHTFRWSGGDQVNPQNFPTRGGRVGLRHCLEAPTGEVFVVVDSAQVEARGTAWLCGQNDLLEDFASGKDPYRKLAAKIFNKMEADVDGKERFVGKTGVLQLQYQAGWRKLQNVLESGAAGPPVVLTDGQSQDSVNTYRGTNTYIVDAWDSLQEHIPILAGEYGKGAVYEWPIGRDVIGFEAGRIHMPNGLDLLYPNVRRHRGQWIYGTGKDPNRAPTIYGGKLLENIVQSLSRIVVGLQMLEIAKRYRVVTMAHDEVVYLAPRRHAKEALDFGIKCFQKCPLPVFEGWPLDGEGIYDKRYIKP